MVGIEVAFNSLIQISVGTSGAHIGPVCECVRVLSLREQQECRCNDYSDKPNNTLNFPPALRET